jgi:hypothetical protein
VVRGCSLPDKVKLTKGVGFDDLLPYVGELTGSKVYKRTGPILVSVPVPRMVCDVFSLQALQELLVSGITLSSGMEQCKIPKQKRYELLVCLWPLSRFR